MSNIKKFRIVENFEVYHPKFLGFPGTMFPKLNQQNTKIMLSKIYQWLGDWKPDIVHLHSIHPLLKISKMISKRYNSKFFITVHGWDFDVGIKNKKIKQLINESISEVSNICVVNKSHLTIAKNIIGKDKSIHIPCHIDIEEHEKRGIQKFNSDLKKLKILFPANPSRKEKNYPLFLKTIKELKKRGWDIEDDCLKNLPRINTIEKFHWADLILLTSRREGGPLVTKEAVFCGTRVACTPVGDCSEWLPSNSISLSHNPQDLAKSVENALDNPPSVWKNLEKFEKRNVLMKLIKMYQIN